MTEKPHDHMPAPLAPIDEMLQDPLVRRAQVLRSVFKGVVASGVLAFGYRMAGPIGLLPGVVLIAGYLTFSRLREEENDLDMLTEISNGHPVQDRSPFP